MSLPFRKKLMPTTPEQMAEGWLSVTQVLDAFIPKGLLAWYLKTGAKEAKRLSTVAMKIGSRVDSLIQEDILKGSYKLSAKDPIEVKNCMEAWKQFKSDYQPTITGVQKEVKSDTQKLVGHIDLIFGATIVDVKCASSIKDNYWLQTAKYSDLLESDTDGIAILRLDKNLGTYQFTKKEQSVVNELVKVYDGLLDAYRYYNPQRGTEE